MTASTATTASDRPRAERGAGFADRLRRARSKRNEDWWSIVFGGPLGTLLAVLVGNVAWITPNRVTWAAFACKLAAVPLILAGGRGADIAAAVLLQLNTVLDCTDGVLARYRGTSSVLGAFLDKVTDALGLLAVMAAFGWRVHHDTGDTAAMVLCIGAATLWLTRIYAYWIVAFFEMEKAVPEPKTGADPRRAFGDLDLAQRLVYYVRSTPRVLFFAEADAFFWLGLALITGWLRPIAWIYGVGLAVWSIIMLARRTARTAAIDAFVRERDRS